ncbi:radical SAM protein [Bacteroides pyogenes]|uniref:radical SAM protein n=1 Tax=Bacteroides pyogenes TaxID=310300 RepID=UPI003B42A38B
METYRLSSYAINVPLKRDNKKELFIHGYSGAIDIIDSAIPQFLIENRNVLTLENFPFSNKTWSTLLRRGYITSKTKDEEHLYVKKMGDLIHQRDKAMHRSFGFVVSYDCNFRCPYCYEAKISEHGKCWEKTTFTKEQVDKVYSLIDSMSINKEWQNRKILLYGGEPFLKENKAIVDYIVKKGCEIGCSFYAISNGYDLEEYKDLLGVGKIERIQITVDGWKPYHNKTRIHKDGHDTFDKIISNISLALKRGVYISVRMNTEGKSFDSYNRLKEHFTEMGFYEFKNFSFYTALIVDYQKENKSEAARQLHYMTREEFCKKNEKMDFKDNFEDWGLTKRLGNSIKNRRCIPLTSTPCSAYVGTYIFDPKGNIYTCWESIGKEDAIVGNYSKDEIEWSPMLSKWHSRNSGKLEKCSRCKYVFLCKGGCVVHALKKGGNFKSSECNNYPLMFKIAANRAYEQYVAEIK